MKVRMQVRMKTFSLVPAALSVWLAAASSAHAVMNTDEAKRDGENKIRGIFEPLRQRYCADECTTLGVDVSVKFRAPENFAPGFDELASNEPISIVPDGATLKLLMDQRVGPATRQRLLELFQKHFDGILEYPVRIDLTTARFPLPLGSARKIAELREKISKQFKDTIENLFAKHCADSCMLADDNVILEPVNTEEAENGSSSEIQQNGEVAVLIKSITGTLLLDEMLTAEERAAIFEMAKLKTAHISKNIALKASVIRFPHPEAFSDGHGGRLPAGKRGKNSTESNSKDEKISFVYENRES